MSLSTRLAALLGISTYQPSSSKAQGYPLDSPEVERARERWGGQISPLPQSQTRWLEQDLEAAEHQADQGMLGQAARLMRAARKDGTMSGVLSTRTAGLVRLPKRFRGDPRIVQELEVGHDSVRSVFDEMCPPSELSALAADGILLGVGVGELVPVEGRDYPVLVRLDPEWLVYRRNENRWYYNSIIGILPITPGDGRWVLHTPGGRQDPWNNGLWKAIGRAYVDKDHARMYMASWSSKLANPARIATAPVGADPDQRTNWFRAVASWGLNTVFSMTPGYDVKLLESNGVGWAAFEATIARSNTDMIVAIAGQVVTTDGGTGFANADIHKSIKADLIKATADDLAYTLNTQAIPPWVITRFGEEALERSAIVEWDVTPPKDRMAEATAIMSAANALSALTAALQPFHRSVDVDHFALKFGIPIQGDLNGDGRPDDATKGPNFAKPASAEENVEDAEFEPSEADEQPQMEAAE